LQATCRSTRQLYAARQRLLQLDIHDALHSHGEAPDRARNRPQIRLLVIMQPYNQSRTAINCMQSTIRNLNSLDTDTACICRVLRIKSPLIKLACIQSTVLSRGRADALASAVQQ